MGSFELILGGLRACRFSPLARHSLHPIVRDYRTSHPIIQSVEIFRQHVPMTWRRFAITTQRLSLEFEGVLLTEFQESSLEVVLKFTNCLVAIIAIEAYGIGVTPFGSPTDIDVVFLAPVYIDHFGQAGIDDARLDSPSFDISDKVSVCLPVVEYDGVSNPLFYLPFIHLQK